MLQLLSKDFILIFHTKFRYLAQKIDILFFARKFLTQKNDCGPIFCIFLHGPPLLLRLTFDDPPLQPCSKIVTHPPIFPSPPPFYFMTGPYITKLHLYIEITWLYIKHILHYVFIHITILGLSLDNHYNIYMCGIYGIMFLRHLL
jgi:hypothetical protein